MSEFYQKFSEIAARDSTCSYRSDRDGKRRRRVERAEEGRDLKS
jgi:hypothetical protein